MTAAYTQEDLVNVITAALESEGSVVFVHKGCSIGPTLGIRTSWLPIDPSKPVRLRTFLVGRGSSWHKVSFLLIKESEFWVVHGMNYRWEDIAKHWTHFKLEAGPGDNA